MRGRVAARLTQGLYDFEVLVDGEGAHGQGFVNVTVKPEPRVNQPPVAVVSPRFQEISLPTSSTVIDGSPSQCSTLTPLSSLSLTVVDSDGARDSTLASLSVLKAVDYPPVANAGPNQVITLPQNSITLFGNQSTDDHGPVSYEWSLSPQSQDKVVEMQVGVYEFTLSVRDERNLASSDTVSVIVKEASQCSTLTPLSSLSLTVVDSDGARDSTLASLSVLKAVDYPPVANAGPNQVITLPQNSITLFGNQSTDDHGPVSYEWSLSPQSQDKVVEMQGVRTSTLQLSAMQEGDYTYQLTVTDSANQQDTAEVTVIVQPGQ
ncbi:UNVERIFIED_CONTAM: hypothetical protein FKN15_049190 [Acipenser sinensis]